MLPPQPSTKRIIEAWHMDCGASKYDAREILILVPGIELRNDQCGFVVRCQMQPRAVMRFEFQSAWNQNGLNIISQIIITIPP
jgi:hypothetical protein